MVFSKSSIMSLVGDDENMTIKSENFWESEKFVRCWQFWMWKRIAFQRSKKSNPLQVAHNSHSGQSQKTKPLQMSLHNSHLWWHTIHKWSTYLRICCLHTCALMSSLVCCALLRHRWVFLPVLRTTQCQCNDSIISRCSLFLIVSHSAIYFAAQNLTIYSVLDEIRHAIFALNWSSVWVYDVFYYIVELHTKRAVWTSGFCVLPKFCSF